MNQTIATPSFNPLLVADTITPKRHCLTRPAERTDELNGKEKGRGKTRDAAIESDEQRLFRWRPSGPAGIVFVEEKSGGRKRKVVGTSEA